MLSHAYVALKALQREEDLKVRAKFIIMSLLQGKARCRTVRHAAGRRTVLLYPAALSRLKIRYFSWAVL